MKQFMKALGQGLAVITLCVIFVWSFVTFGTPLQAVYIVLIWIGVSVSTTLTLCMLLFSTLDRLTDDDNVLPHKAAYKYGGIVSAMWVATMYAVVFLIHFGDIGISEIALKWATIAINLLCILLVFLHFVRIEIPVDE